MVNWLHTELTDCKEKYDELEDKYTQAQEMIMQKVVTNLCLYYIYIYIFKYCSNVIQGLKGGLVVAKKLVANDLWLVVNGDWASCKLRQK